MSTAQSLCSRCRFLLGISAPLPHRSLPFRIFAMSDVDRDIANMKCWAVVVLICSIFSFNLAIFITGIVGASQVLCCASSG